jgi:hypothetical protein
MGVPEVVGRRVPDGTPELELEPGDYGRLVVPAKEGELRGAGALDGYLAVNLPAVGRWTKPHRARVSPQVHTLEEHEDGTWSLDPSISLKTGDGIELWHGFLKRGVWTAA